MYAIAAILSRNATADLARSALPDAPVRPDTPRHRRRRPRWRR
ncbi:MAG: hypothetical protein QOE03_411 [Micromonosporaceae bacterium]|jgi:hypothetical protein|nr:hypothetical protein [Micromonosporaceae bacterium]